MRLLFLYCILILSLSLQAQTNTYTVSFDNAEHHEAVVRATFPNVKTSRIVAQMSRSSPGRYAIHEFAKNVYGLVATNSKGDTLEVTRPDPYSWEINNTDGTINIEYTLFANRGGGTYSQIDLTHGHLNIPATFIYVDALKERPIEVTFEPRKDLNWKIATQLKPVSGNTFYATNLYYFLDSPVEISDFKIREFDLDGQKIRFVLHDPGTEEDFDTYFDNVKEIVKQQKAIYGELPNFDYGTYTFLACYMPNASGDGMEHRNSTVLTNTKTLANGGMESNIGTVSHEFFHSWNVERMRPEDLEPFDFSKANMSRSLWFAEGFTSYYTNLILERAGIMTPEEYVKSLNGTFNYVWNSPAHHYFNPIEMSMQAPFVDAATSIDPVNRENTFISYYSYGTMLGLALDLELRVMSAEGKEKNLNLDDFMKLMWKKYGTTEVAYSIADIEQTLAEYAGTASAKAFFDHYIYKSKMPDYKELFKSVGLTLSQNISQPTLGISVSPEEEGMRITRNIIKGSAAYSAGLDIDDLITAIDGSPVNTVDAMKTALENKKVGDKVSIQYTNYGQNKTVKFALDPDVTYSIKLDAKAGKKELKARESWLEAKN